MVHPALPGNKAAPSRERGRRPCASWTGAGVSAGAETDSGVDLSRGWRGSLVHFLRCSRRKEPLSFPRRRGSCLQTGSGSRWCGKPAKWPALGCSRVGQR